MKYRILFAAMAAAIFSMTACKKDKATEEENITTIEVHLTGADFDKKFYWKDTDGDGIANSIDTVSIPAFRTGIQCHLHVYDESETPIIDLTEEIEAENTAHLFVYTVTGASISIENKNKDDNGKEFALTSTWSSGIASKGNLGIKLFHQPTNKDDLSNPGGEVDFDVVFPVALK